MSSRIRLLVPLLALFVTGCVPKKKYDDLLSQQADAQVRSQQALSASESANQDLKSALAQEQAQVKDLGDQIAALQARYDGDTAALRSEKAELLKDKTRLKASVEEVTAALNDLAQRKAQAEARVASYKDMLARFQTLIDAGRLQVKIVDGRMIVVLATDVLFDSGKADLSDAGKAAIAEVGAVLAQMSDRSFQVEGHTDNVPIKTAQYPSNWELGSARAVTVVRSLVEAGVDPSHVSAASYSEYRPVSANDSKEGKAANRRIEIVVVPDLSQLPGFEELQALSNP